MPFGNSSHARHWIFSREDLQATRLKIDQNTRARLRADIDYITIQEQSILFHLLLIKKYNYLF